VPLLKAKVVREFTSHRQQHIKEHEGHPLNGRLGILRAEPEELLAEEELDGQFHPLRECGHVA
jgi:hypothetical protein